MAKSVDNLINTTYKQNKDIINANDRASYLSAAMTLALNAKQNDYELKVLLIVFAGFVLYLVF